MEETRYRQIYQLLKAKIQQGHLEIGASLPSENELCRDFSITRTTARRALDELVKEGFIERTRGRRSVVRERRQSLGLLAIKGFSEATGNSTETKMVTKPVSSKWPDDIVFNISEAELAKPCIFFSRIRKYHGRSVMFESNWFSSIGLEDFMDHDFIDGSFFKTLSQRYLIEITSSAQELHAIRVAAEVADQLEIKAGSPVLQICIKFTTSWPQLNIYGRLFCNTEIYPIGNIYKP